MPCFPSHYLICLEHLQAGNKGSQGDVSANHSRDVNGGVDEEKAGQDS